jgi:hypothetical protein
MGRKSGAGAVALVAVLLSTSVLARAPKCALPDEVTAIQAAAIQQELMVAALTCDQISSFNQFQVSFGPELRSSDAKLEHMFKRLFGAGTGEAQYNAFKTRLANNSSVSSIHDNSNYCRTAGLVFAAALTPAKPALADFVAGIPVTDPSPVNSCEIRVAGGMAGMPSAVIVPKPNPLRLAMVTPPVLVAPPPPPAQAPVPAADQQKEPPKDEKKPSGWLSGIFN